MFQALHGAIQTLVLCLCYLKFGLVLHNKPGTLSYVREGRGGEGRGQRREGRAGEGREGEGRGGEGTEEGVEQGEEVEVGA